jgi:hypothetical protein
MSFSSLVAGGPPARATLSAPDESLPRPSDPVVTDLVLHRAIVQRSNSHDGMIGMRPIPNKVKQLSARYRQLRDAPAVSEIAPDIAKQQISERIAFAGNHKLEVRLHRILQALDPFGLRPCASRFFQPLRNLASVRDHQSN